MSLTSGDTVKGVINEKFRSAKSNTNTKQNYGVRTIRRCSLYPLFLNDLWLQSNSNRLLVKANAQEGLDHATKAGELVTMLGGHPSLKIGALLETEKHDTGDILRESLEHESVTAAVYYELLELVDGESVVLEEYARQMINLEELHLDEVNKMLRMPGDLAPFEA